MAREEDDFRGRRKKVAITSADAEAWIRAKREEREEFEKNEGKPLYAHDEQMNRLQREHAEIGAREERQQREFSEKRKADDKRLADQQQQQQQQHQQQKEAAERSERRDQLIQFAEAHRQSQAEERDKQEQEQGRSM